MFIDPSAQVRPEHYCHVTGFDLSESLVGDPGAFGKKALCPRGAAKGMEEPPRLVTKRVIPSGQGGKQVLTRQNQT